MIPDMRTAAIYKRLSTPLTYFAVLLFLAAVPAAVFAGDDWQPIRQDELKMTSEPSQPGAAAVVLYREENNDDNERYEYNYRRIKIFTEQGKKYADVKIPYDDKYMHISDVKARTIHADGTIVPFSGKLLDSTLVKGKGIKILQKTLTLPDVQVGSIIEYKYKVRWQEGIAYAPHWDVQDELLQKHSLFSFTPFKGQVMAEDGTYAHVAWTTEYLPSSAELKNKGQRIELQMDNVPAFQAEELAPPENELKMRVRFYYASDNTRNSEEFWDRAGVNWSKHVEKFIGRHSDTEAAARQLVLPTDNSEQKLQKLYARVQQLDNLTYKRDRTVEEAKKENYKDNKGVDDVLRQNSGDRDEIARLFVAMARAIGFNAQIIRVSRRDENFFSDKLLDFDQLTSEIAVVHADGKDLYLDPGTRHCPYGILYWTRSGVRGLLEDGKKAQFVTTPAPKAKDAVTQRLAAVTLSEDGSLTGKLRILFQGQEALTHRIDERLNDEAGRTKDLEEEVRAWLPNTATVHLLSVKGWDSQDESIDASFSLEVPGYAAATGKRLLMNSDFFTSNEKQPFVHDKRINPVYFPYPYVTIDSISINLPPGLQIESMPKERQVSDEVGAYLVKCKSTGQKLTYDRQFMVGAFYIPIKYYPTVKSLYEQVKASDDEPTILRAATIAQK